MVNIQEAIRLSGLSRAELHRRMARGELAFAKQGRKRLIPRKAIILMSAQALVVTPRS